MSLYDNTLEETYDIENGFKDRVKTWDWVRRNLNFTKFRYRVKFAHENPNVPTKMVLMEYHPLHEHLFGSGALDYLHYMLADRRPNVVVYTRCKVINGKMIDPEKRQLVIKFNNPVPPPPPPPPQPEELDVYSVVESLDSSE